MKPALTGRYILGFDVREPGGRIFTEKEKAAFLLRLDVERVVSCDGGVWPSVFRSRDRPQYVGFFQELWEDLDNLREQVTSNALAPSDVIAVAVFADLFLPEEAERWRKRLQGVSPDEAARQSDLELPQADPSTVLETWRFLGHDVCDEWGLSGLSSCGFQPQTEDVAGLRTTWGPRLNRHHLFDSLDHATAFKTVANHRAKEHAPFFVYGLWLIEQVKG